jgi:hypothetical protein
MTWHASLAAAVPILISFKSLTAHHFEKIKVCGGYSAGDACPSFAAFAAWFWAVLGTCFRVVPDRYRVGAGIRLLMKCLRKGSNPGRSCAITLLACITCGACGDDRRTARRTVGARKPIVRRSMAGSFAARFQRGPLETMQAGPALKQVVPPGPQGYPWPTRWHPAVTGQHIDTIAAGGMGGRSR